MLARCLRSCVDSSPSSSSTSSCGSSLVVMACRAIRAPAREPLWPARFALLGNNTFGMACAGHRYANDQLRPFSSLPPWKKPTGGPDKRLEGRLWPVRMLSRPTGNLDTQTGSERAAWRIIILYTLPISNLSARVRPSRFRARAGCRLHVRAGQTDAKTRSLAQIETIRKHPKMVLCNLISRSLGYLRAALNPQNYSSC